VGISMPSDLIIAMEEASREIRKLIAKVSATHVETNNAALPPGELQVLSRRLAQVAQQLACVSPAQPREEAFQAAISAYVVNLEALKRVLGKVQDSLGKKRDRLKKDLEHMNSARAWAEAYRATHGT